MVCPKLASGCARTAMVVCPGPPLLMSVCPASLLPVPAAPSNSHPTVVVADGMSTGVLVLVQLMSGVSTPWPHGNFRSPPTIRFAGPTSGES